MKTPNSTVIAQRIKRGWTEERARSTPTLPPGRQRVTIMRAVVVRRTREQGRIVWYEATVRGDGTRTYLRAYQTREEAEQACARYIATGEKPESLKQPREANSSTRPRKPRQKPQEAAKREKAPDNSRSFDRLESLRRIYREKFTN